MERGKSQVMYKFLPGAVYSLEGGQGIGRTEWTDVDEIRESELDPEYTMEVLRRYISQWELPAAEDRDPLARFPSLTTFNFALVEPARVQYSLFPLSFKCTSCSRVRSFWREEDALEEIEGGICPDCNEGSFVQLHYVQVHHCGEIAPIFPPKCNRCGSYRDVALDDKGKRAFRDVDWRCLECGQRIEVPLSKPCRSDSCPETDEDKKWMRTLVHTASPVFYPHGVSLVNLGSIARQELLEDRAIFEVVAAACLDILPTEVDVRSAIESVWAQSQGGGLTPEEQRQVDNAETEEFARKLRDLFLEQKQLREMPDIEGIEEATKRVRELGLTDQDAHDEESLVRELLEFSIGRDSEEMGEKSLDNLIEESEDEGWKSMASAQRGARERLDALGVTHASFLHGFPLAQINYGYTRASKEPSKAFLRPFRQLSHLEKHPIYVVQTRTEGIMLRLSALPVLRWMVEQDLVELENHAPLKDEMRAQAWFLQRTMVPRSFEIQEKDEVRYPAFTLLHTLAHLFLRGAANHSGLDRASLREYIFPHTLAFVIYHNTQVDTSLGALYTLFEQSLGPWLETVTNQGEDCIYDPVCRESYGASCHACTHVGEYSCERFNRFLDRRLVFGDPDGELGIEGFWSDEARHGRP